MNNTMTLDGMSVAELDALGRRVEETRKQAVAREEAEAKAREEAQWVYSKGTGNYRYRYHRVSERVQTSYLNGAWEHTGYNSLFRTMRASNIDKNALCELAALVRACENI